MKLESISGANLASLAGEFPVDLTAEPLASQGVFAIVGPTGAGKTTLLDAMALALFGHTPRLTGVGRTKAAAAETAGGGTRAAAATTAVVALNRDEALTARDPRLVLRKSSTRGWAEVVFIGVDGERFRARWEVRRARDKLTGKLQEPQHSLWRWEGGAWHSLTGTRTETRKAIVRALGLSFEQFHRAAVLAQGQFAAFLHAPSKERSELLERITGAEIYTKISQLVHAQAAEGARLGRELSAELARCEVPSDEARQSLRARLDAGAQEQARWDALALRWREVQAHRLQVEAARQSEREAVAAMAELEARSGEMQALAAELDAHDALSRYKPLVGQLRVVEAAAATCEQDVAEARVAVALAEAQREALEQELARDRTVLGAAERIEARVQARVAAVVPTMGGHVARRAQQVPASAEELSRQVADAEEAWTQATATFAEAATVHRWLHAAGESSEARALGCALGRYEPVLQRLAAQHAHACEQQEVAERKAARAMEAERDAVASVAGSDAAVTAASDAWRAAQAACEREASLVPAHEQALRRRYDEARGAVQRARAAMTVVAAARARAGELARVDAEASAAREALATAEAFEQKARARSQEAAAVVAHAQRAWQRTQETLAAEDLRRSLQPGQPCPVCGSHEHPHATREVAALVAVSEQQWREALAAEKQAQAGLQAAAGAVTQTRAQLEALARQHNFLRDELADHDARWGEWVAAAGQLVLVTQASSDEALRDVEAWLARAEAESAAARRALDEHAAATARLAELRQAEALAREALDAARARALGAMRGREQAAAHREVAAAAAAQACAQVAGLTTQWHELVAGLIARPWPGDAISAASSETSSAAPGRAGARDAASAAQPSTPSTPSPPSPMPSSTPSPMPSSTPSPMPSSTPSSTPSPMPSSTPSSTPSRSSADAPTPSWPLPASWPQWGPVCGALAAAHQRRVALQRALDAQRRALVGELAALRERQEATLRERERRLAQLRTEVGAAGAACVLAFQESGVDEATAARLALVPVEQVEAERRTLEHARAEQLRMQATCVERAARVAALVAAAPPPPEVSEPEVVAHAERTRQEQEQLRWQLQRGEEARERATALAEQLRAHLVATQAQAELDELLGSADGKKFRAYAQRLTMRNLLDAANQYLGELSGRFRLLQPAGQDMELAVLDGDMADEVRGVESLSGGETFLVSLALALGLSEIASHQVRVNTLFIDEGFGSLDPQSLDAALAILDRLQAQGRQIGVISHIPGLAERFGGAVEVASRGAGASTVVVRGAAA